MQYFKQTHYSSVRASKSQDARSHGYVQLDQGTIVRHGSVTNGLYRGTVARNLANWPWIADFASSTRLCLDGESIRATIFNQNTEFFSQIAGKDQIKAAIGEALASVPHFDKPFPSERDRNDINGAPLPSNRDDGKSGIVLQWHHLYSFTDGALKGQTIRLYMKAFIPDGKLDQDNPIVICCHPDNYREWWCAYMQQQAKAKHAKVKPTFRQKHRPLI